MVPTVEGKQQMGYFIPHVRTLSNAVSLTTIGRQRIIELLSNIRIVFELLTQEQNLGLLDMWSIISSSSVDCI
jgi:hypothetical protein